MIPVFQLIINIGNITGMAVFALLYLCIDRFEEVKKWIRNTWQSISGRILITVCSILIAGIFGTAGFLGIKMITGFNTVNEYNGETVVVLGCEVRKDGPSKMLTERLKAAYTFLNEHPDAVCVVSGGQGTNEITSEAEAMYTWLMNKGIDPNRLYKEDRSTSTKENLAFTKKVIADNDLDPDIIIVTSGFHEYRAGLIADTLDMNHKAYGAHTAWWLLPTFTVREMYGILYQYATQ